MPTDSLFYLIFQTSPSIIFELIGNLDPRGSTYSFASQEVKQTNFRIDGILVPPSYASDLPLYFVEIQGYKDTKNVLYSSFFSQIFLYLHDYQPINDWRGLLIFTKRSLDPGLPIHYQDFADSPRFRRVYLDELGERSDLSIGLSLLQLIGTKESAAPEKARQLAQRATQEATEALDTKKILELIETVFIYKFPDLGRQEIQEMLGLNELKQTKVYQEALEEGRQEGREESRQEALEEGLQKGRQQGKLEALPLLLKAGVTVDEIAQQLGLDIQTVREAASQIDRN
ncbi:MAG: Rpn family recombination-promoting nuclease/putative transposase [Cyanosarcina radialis HA8281-LM2]|nr:Rpn family recombination-promoting nuclease/putative transposase [Cyanosarcina radialis HA8281-LM2]